MEPITPEFDQPARPVPNALRALSHKNFRIFVMGQSISLTGTWIQQIAMSWLVYRITGSAALLGTVTFLGQLPVFLLATTGGVVADRGNRRRILIITQALAMFQALGLGIVTLLGQVHTWHLIVFSVLLGLTNAFDMPTRQAFLSDMVERPDLPNAIALNASMFHGSRIIGPSIAGILVGIFGEGWCFLINAVSFVAVLASLYAIQTTAPQETRKRKSALAELLEGIHYSWHHQMVRMLLVLVAIGSLFGFSFMVLMPVFASSVLHGGADSMGILMGASGAGAVVATLTLAMRRKPLHPGVPAMAILGFGVGLVCFSFSTVLFLSVVMLVPVGFTSVMLMASSNTMIQSSIPDGLRGRVLSLFSTLFLGLAPFGALYVGHLAEKVGAPIATAVGGIVCILAGSAALIARHHRQPG